MRVVIVGAGPAGLTVAETVRAHDRQARITLLSAEREPPYSPPAMADHFLTGRDDALFWRGRDVCARLELDFRAGVPVTGVDPAERTITLENTQRLGYDRLVIASGSRLYAPVPGSDLDGIANFKSLRAARALVAQARRGAVRRAIIVGAGFIGVEVAVLLGELGVTVTLIEAEERVMPRMLDPESAALVAGALTRRGIRLRLGTPVARFAGDPQVEHVELGSGEVVPADLFVAATGVKPNLELLAGAGLDTGWGVHVDDHLRTSAPDVYAVGDVAETRDRLTGERAVHAIFPNAVEQARVAAWNLLGHEVRYAGAESMNSLKHVGLPVMAVGAPRGAEELRMRAGQALRKVFLDGGRIVGFQLVGDVRGAGVYRALMLRRADVTRWRSALVDPSFGAGHLVLAASPRRAPFLLER